MLKGRDTSFLVLLYTVYKYMRHVMVLSKSSQTFKGPGTFMSGLGKVLKIYGILENGMYTNPELIMIRQKLYCIIKRF